MMSYGNYAAERAHPHPEDAPARRVDADPVIKFGNYIEKWFRLAWPALVGIAGWYAHSIKEPIQRIPEMAEAIRVLQQNAIVAARTDSISIEERRELRTGVLMLIDMRCDEKPTTRCKDFDYLNLKKK